MFICYSKRTSWITVNVPSCSVNCLWAVCSECWRGKTQLWCCETHILLLRWERASGDDTVQAPAQSRVSRAVYPQLCPIGFGIPPRMETPRLSRQCIAVFIYYERKSANFWCFTKIWVCPVPGYHPERSSLPASFIQMDQIPPSLLQVDHPRSLSLSLYQTFNHLHALYCSCAVSTSVW